MRSGKKHIVGDLELDNRVTAQGLAGLYDNVMLLAFRLAVDGSLSKYNLVDGLTDEFEDETGVDTENSTYENYISADDCYTNSMTESGNDAYTKLLVHFDGIDGSKEIIDSGNTGHISTQNGTAQLVAGGALWLDGNSDCLTLADHADWTFGSSQFTVEGWFYLTALPSSGLQVGLISHWDGGDGIDDRGWIVGVHNDSGIYKVRFTYCPNDGVSAVNVYTTEGYSWLNTWHHIAVTRNANSLLTIYVDGVSAGTADLSGVTIYNSSNELIVGASEVSGGTKTLFMTGLVDEIRISNTSRYSTTFTPAVAPFTADANTKLLLHFDGPNNFTTFYDDTGKTVTTVGTAKTVVDYKVSSLAKIGTSALWLDGNSDYLSIPQNADFNFGDNNFTIEFWSKFNSLPSSGSSYYLISYFNASSAVYYIRLYNSSGTQQIHVRCQNSSGTNIINIVVNQTLTTHTWYHFAFVRNGNKWDLYLDGISIGNVDATAHTLLSGDMSLTIGARYDGADAYSSGWFDEIRFSNSARYTTNFTPATSAFTSDANTKLLLHMDTLDYSGIVSGNTYKIPTFIGTAQLDTAQYKFGSSSLLLDGNSDYISFPDSNDWFLVNEDFTIDFWVRFSSVSSSQPFVEQYEDSNNAFTIYWSSSSEQLVFNHYNGGADKAFYYCSWSPSIDTWYHVVVERSGSNCLMFIDGVSQSVSSSQAFITGTNISGILKIGYRQATSTYLNGYIDEFRISKGIARWTTDFSVPMTEYSTTSLIDDMSLQSNSSTAEATPTSARIVLFEEDIASLTLNTDLKAWVSRDDGTTWTQATLSDEGDYESSKRVLAGNLDISGQPLGTSLKWKVTTHNSKNIKLHGVGLLWD